MGPSQAHRTNCIRQRTLKKWPKIIRCEKCKIAVENGHGRTSRNINQTDDMVRMHAKWPGFNRKDDEFVFHQEYCSSERVAIIIIVN